MRLAKPFIDLGLQTNQRESMLEFWGQTVGLEFEPSARPASRPSSKWLPRVDPCRGFGG